MDEIKFYGKNEETMRFSKDVMEAVSTQTSKHFSDALKSVMEKDLVSLNEKIDKIVLEIIKKLALVSVIYNEKKDYKASNLDELINFVETNVSDLIIEKGSIRIGLFTSKKKEKKNRIKLLEEVINYLTKCQDELVIIKKECDKLSKRDLAIENIEFSSEIKEESYIEDPLERTISFYMKKQENSN